MLLQYTAPESQSRLRNARRFFSLVPLLLFLVTLTMFSSVGSRTYVEFLHVVLLSVVVAMAAMLVSIAAYGFYRYLLDRSPGL